MVQLPCVESGSPASTQTGQQRNGYDQISDNGWKLSDNVWKMGISFTYLLVSVYALSRVIVTNMLQPLLQLRNLMQTIPDHTAKK